MAEDKKQATWGGRFTSGPSDLMLRIGESVSFDRRLAAFDIQGSKAHASMLAKVGLLSGAEREAICDGLDRLLERITEGTFTWDPALEDVHMNIEQALTEAVPAAAKLHAARSRNDQIATDMRLWFKHACRELDEALLAVLEALLDFADRAREVIIPGYTHLQRAQPVSMAHHLLAYVEMFARDRGRLASVYEAANVCPLGSGAIAGTTLPIDRAFVAVELGFVDAAGEPRLSGNSMDAVSDRDTFVDFASACATVGLHLSRLAEDFILWNSAEFGFVRLPDAFTPGSSLMPQKKNPDVLELARATYHRLVAEMQSLATLPANLPGGYHRDLQLTKGAVMRALQQTDDLFAATTAAVSGLRFRTEPAARACTPEMLATHRALKQVAEGVPFRTAYQSAAGSLSDIQGSLSDIQDVTESGVLSTYATLGHPGREVPGDVRGRLADHSWTHGG